MSTTSQQQEAQSFFDQIARNWRNSAEGKADSVNVIAQRNNYVLRVADGRENVRTALDVGCGTGELVHELCKRGLLFSFSQNGDR
jgi:2-polyprenyl-3-methyl-5-hydroxy-6-metoxy-1,4-benzoquinol methylase